VKITPRQYQQAIYDSINEKGNTLVVLPTGLGKTLIAVMLIKDKIKQGRCLVMTPTKPLAKQHQSSIMEILELDEVQVALVTGEIAPAKRKDMYNTDVIVSTPQTIRNDIENKVLKPDFSLVIFDECHRAIGDYAYTHIAEFLDDKKTLFVGLTASPGGRMDRIKKVMKALKIENVEIRSQEDPDVEPYVQKSTVTWVQVALSPHFKLIKRELDSLSSKYAKRLAALLHVLHMSELLETQGIFPIRGYIEKIEKKTSKSAALLIREPTFANIKRLCSKDEDHPKMPVLIKKINEMNGKKMIVFVQYRAQISRIEKVLNEKGIKAKQFVGKKDGVTRKIQEETIAEFRGGKFDVLVASMIGEEGLDIPAVDAVIFYEPVPSEIRSIQRRGRAARLKEGEVIVLMTRGTRDEFYYYASQNKEKRMKSILTGMQKSETPIKGMRKAGKKFKKMKKVLSGQTKMSDFN